MDVDFINENFPADEVPAVMLEAVKFDALKGIDVQHAAIMRRLTGDATIEERDTWQSKELAARALLDGSATDAQVEMLAIEAQYIGSSPQELATVIVAKSDLFKKLTGLAAGVRGKSRAAIKAAIDFDAVAGAVEAARVDATAAIALLQQTP